MIEIRVSGRMFHLFARWGIRFAAGGIFALGLLLFTLSQTENAAAQAPQPDFPEAPFGTRISLPVLSFVGFESTSQSILQVQNTGSEFTRAILLVWPESTGACGPQSVGPFKVECSGVLKPGSTWIFGDGQLPVGAKSGIVYTFPHEQIEVGGELVAVADEFCERLFADVTFDADAFRRFDLAFRQGDDFFGLPTTGGQPISTDVVRIGQGTPSPDLTVSGAYSGVTSGGLGAFDPVFGGFGYYTPVVYADAGGLTSFLYIQNSGSDCTGVELWFQEQDDCLRAQVCEILTLAPGETAQYSVSDCVGPSFVGSLWLRTSQPSGIVVDHVGQDILMTDNAVPARNAIFDSGSEILYGPLIYREFQGWETGISVQNLSSTQTGAVKVYFMDQSGDIITTLVDYVCPRGTQTFFLPVINGLPGQFVGSVRVESQTPFRNASPDGPFVPIAAVAHLMKFADPTTSQAQEAISYNLFAEDQVYDWQLGPGLAGLIGVPSVLKQSRGLSTELAIHNVNPNPGFTDFAMYIYDQNGLLEVLCEKLNAKQVEYINFNAWGLFNPGFTGSVVISSVFSTQNGGAALSAVAIQRVQSILQFNAPGDESSGHEAAPILTSDEGFDFEGTNTPRCPGLEQNICRVAVQIKVTEDGKLSGDPVPNALVQLRLGNQPIATSTTDALGVAVLNNVPAGVPPIDLVKFEIHVQRSPSDTLQQVGTLTLLRVHDLCGQILDQYPVPAEPLTANITGHIFLDANDDCIAGPEEVRFANARVILDDLTDDDDDDNPEVIATAGGPEKCDFVKSIGADAVVDYKAADNLTAAIQDAATKGIDGYFENVGGTHFTAALNTLKPKGRIAACGMIQRYNDAQPATITDNLTFIVGKSLKIQGFIVTDHADMMDGFVRDLSAWMAAGKIKPAETVIEGIENAPDAFMGLFSGRNTGKMLVKI